MRNKEAKKRADTTDSLMERDSERSRQREDEIVQSVSENKAGRGLHQVHSWKTTQKESSEDFQRITTEGVR